MTVRHRGKKRASKDNLLNLDGPPYFMRDAALNYLTEDAIDRKALGERIQHHSDVVYRINSHPP